MTDKLNARKLEKLTGYLMAIPMDEQMNIVNFISVSYGDSSDYIYPNVEDLVEGLSPIDAVRTVYFGKLGSWYDYVQLDGYGNVKSWYGLDQSDAAYFADLLLEHGRVKFDYYLHMTDGSMLSIDDPDDLHEEIDTYNAVRGTTYTVADVKDIEPDVTSVNID